MNNANQQSHLTASSVKSRISLITHLCRIFGDLKFVTDLGILGGAEFKNRIRFCPSGQD